MIGAVDAILRHVLLAGVPNLTADKLSFQPPDDDWRQRVGATQGMSLDVYLADIHEDRRLRTNEHQRVIDQGIVHDTPAPTRIRLTYVVSAWNAVADSPANPATEAEHDTLSFVLRALLRAAPFNAARILPVADLAAVPVGMREADLPTTVAPPDGFAKLAEFWSTMGKGRPFKPVVPVAVTVPVTYPETTIEGVVLTIDTIVGDEELVELGGHVMDASGAGDPVPVGNAAVVATTPAGRHAAAARTRGDGRFVIDGLRPGKYEINFAADGYATPAAVQITVPEPSGGSLELLFT